MDIERPETPLGLRITGWVAGGIVALLVLRLLLGVVRWMFTVAVLIAVVSTVLYVVQRLKKS